MVARRRAREALAACRLHGTGCQVDPTDRGRSHRRRHADRVSLRDGDSAWQDRRRRSGARRVAAWVAILVAPLGYLGYLGVVWRHTGSPTGWFGSNRRVGHRIRLGPGRFPIREPLTGALRRDRPGGDRAGDRRDHRPDRHQRRRTHAVAASAVRNPRHRDDRAVERADDEPRPPAPAGLRPAHPHRQCARAKRPRSATRCWPA